MSDNEVTPAFQPDAFQQNAFQTKPLTLDAPGTLCAFASNGCTAFLSGRGGFDQHHKWPVSLGGPENPEDLLALCPSHHRRQHSLIRYLVQLAGAAEAWAVVGHFTTIERDTARYAVAKWQAAGSPAIAGWPSPAAR